MTDLLIVVAIVKHLMHRGEFKHHEPVRPHRGDW